MKDSYFKNSNQLILECKINGNPKPNIIWYKDNVVIKYNRKFKIHESSNNITQLIISDISEEDNGIYTCAAENIIGNTKIDKIINISDYISIARNKNQIKDNEIKEKEENLNTNQNIKKIEEHKSLLSFETNLKHVTTQINNNIQLECIIRGNLDKIVWLKDGKNIENSSKYKIQKSEKRTLYTTNF